MPKWNRFSPEVAQERATVRAYGVDKVNDRDPVPDAYKWQALRELALRLELESKVAELEREVSRLTDLAEAKGTL